MRNQILLAVMLGMLTGCVSYQAPSYTAMSDSAQKIKASQTEYRVVLKQTPANDDGAVMCRGAGPVIVGGGKRYSDYIVEALSSDLKNASSFSEKSPYAIQAAYTKITFQSSMGAANWYIHGAYSIGEESVNIDTIYNDRSSFSADTACNNMAIYFPKAVAAHLNQLYSSHLFKSANLGKETQVQSLKERLIELRNAHADGLITDDEFDAGRKKAIEGR